MSSSRIESDVANKEEVDYKQSSIWQNNDSTVISIGIEPTGPR